MFGDQALFGNARARAPRGGSLDVARCLHEGPAKGGRGPGLALFSPRRATCYASMNDPPDRSACLVAPARPGLNPGSGGVVAFHDRAEIGFCNFSIIAHIDHGKSTLADQFLLERRAPSPNATLLRALDSRNLERERGITIRMHPVTVYYEYQGKTYELNLVDTPGHVGTSITRSRAV